MSSQNIHIVSAGERWAVEADGGHGREKFVTLAAAIAAGTKKAQEKKVELLIHGRDGHIRVRNSFGNDQRDIKG